jgi:5-methyltetrahydrofolate--homocysteine methyltransferase
VKARAGTSSSRVRTGQTLVFDGGYGTMLFAAGLLNGRVSRAVERHARDGRRGIHRGYFDAGSHIVETNTFGGTRLKLDEYSIGDRTRELNVKGARLASSVAPASGLGRRLHRPTSRCRSTTRSTTA